MSVQLLDKTRKINKLLHNNNSSKVVFNDICEVLTEILSSNVLVVSKRNHINKFKIMYEDRWSYEPMTKDNVEDCFQMALKWRNENGCEEDLEKNAEICVTLNSLRLFEELGLKGGVLRIDGEVAAFTVGEPICSDTFGVHIEKAYAEVQGAYPMINQQFVSHECMDYKYVNREEDTGAEGLRKAKMSYRPVFMVEKGTVTRK